MLNKEQKVYLDRILFDKSQYIFKILCDKRSAKTEYEKMYKPSYYEEIIQEMNPLIKEIENELEMIMSIREQLK